MKVLCVATTREDGAPKKVACVSPIKAFPCLVSRPTEFELASLGWSRLLLSPAWDQTPHIWNHYTSFNVLTMPSKSFSSAVPFFRTTSLDDWSPRPAKWFCASFSRLMTLILSHFGKEPPCFFRGRYNLRRRCDSAAILRPGERFKAGHCVEKLW